MEMRRHLIKGWLKLAFLRPDYRLAIDVNLPQDVNMTDADERKGGPETPALASTLKEGIMANKASFTPDEWKELLQSPLLVGIAVSAADPSGLIGMLKESMASARVLLQAKADPGADELVKAVADDFVTAEGRGLAQDGVKAMLAGAKPADIKAKAVAALGGLSTLIASKAPADALAYKTWLAGVAKAVAEAAPEGGFLGFGGTQVSEAEKATVGDIATALGVPAPAL
jgi:hypothetical protein